MQWKTETAAQWVVTSAPGDELAEVTVVLPAFRSAGSIRAVVAAIPASVRHVVVVDDASPDEMARVLATIDDPRLIVIRHAENRGVGGAMKTGFAKALELGSGVVVKLDSDGQMDPGLIPRLVAPILAGADVAKGNRFTDLRRVRSMPIVRRIGNLGLSFLVKLASGYWSLFDPCNGFVALRGSLLRSLEFDRIADRYFFEISLLCEVHLRRAVVRDVPIPVVYGEETSSLSPTRSLLEFLPRLLHRTVRRIGHGYFLRDFNVVSVFLTTGVPLLAFGLAWSGWHWYLSWASGIYASTGTVIVGTLSIILGFQLLLQAIVLDVQNEPGRNGP
jgi:glycosyltransferase involved in cell wall biosynthesis